jgi:hypothetical protein
MMRLIVLLLLMGSLLCDTEGEAPKEGERGEWCRYGWIIWVVGRCISIIILLTMNAICETWKTSSVLPTYLIIPARSVHFPSFKEALHSISGVYPVPQLPQP